MPVVVKAITNIISPQDNDMENDYLSLFSKATVSITGFDDGRVKIWERIIGAGIKEVQPWKYPLVESIKNWQIVSWRII